MDSFNQNNVKANLHDTNFSRIGIITLSTDFTIEQDFRKICHNLPVDLFFNRIPFLNPLTHENYIKMADHLTETTNQILPNEKIQVVAYGCTSGTIEIGEKRIRSEIFKAKPDALITTPITASVKALKLLNHKKIAVLTPYPKDVNITVYNYLNDNNINVGSFSSFNLEYDSEIAQVSLDSLEKEITKIDLSKVDGLFVSCTALKIVDVLDKIEKKQNTIVISSNQAIIWDCLRSVGVDSKINGYGKLFVS